IDIDGGRGREKSKFPIPPQLIAKKLKIQGHGFIQTVSPPPPPIGHPFRLSNLRRRQALQNGLHLILLFLLQAKPFLLWCPHRRNRDQPLQPQYHVRSSIPLRCLHLSGRG
ncbi:hypothetical protein F2P56_021150, partial [Juglans regia]